MTSNTEQRPAMPAAGAHQLMTSADVSAMLAVPVGTLDQWAYRSVGPAYLKVGKHRRYRLEDVQSWLDGQRRGGTREAVIARGRHTAA